MGTRLLVAGQAAPASAEPWAPGGPQGHPCIPGATPPKKNPKPGAPGGGGWGEEGPAYLARCAGHGGDVGAPSAGRHRAGGCRGSIGPPPGGGASSLRGGTGTVGADRADSGDRLQTAPAMRLRAARSRFKATPCRGWGGAPRAARSRLLRAAHPAGATLSGEGATSGAGEKATRARGGGELRGVG